MSPTLLVALGGLVGCVARYWLSGALQRLGGTDFPVGTLGVNLMGSFVLGLLMTLSLERGVIGGDLRLALTTGVCGGFTTMSTFSYETVALANDGQAALALGNIGITVLGCTAAVWLGTAAARAV